MLLLEVVAYNLKSEGKRMERWFFLLLEELAALAKFMVGLDQEPVYVSPSQAHENWLRHRNEAAALAHAGLTLPQPRRIIDRAFADWVKWLLND